MTSLVTILMLAAPCAAAPPAQPAAQPSSQQYAFDGTISRAVLENYLGRSITVLDLLTGKGNVDDNLRMLHETGVKLAGRAIYLWGGESRLPGKLETARPIVAKIHERDPELILQAGLFEIVTRDVERLAVPARVFEAFGRPAEKRHFRYEAMLGADWPLKNHWHTGSSVPDIRQPETKRWFYYLGVTYLDLGCEAFHIGQIELIGRRDPAYAHWWAVLTRLRAYAKKHARRHLVLVDGHVPSGGVLYQGGKLLCDFHSFPLRIKAVTERPQEGVLRKGFLDSIFGKSKGGITPSGRRCDHLPYLVELDNFGRSRHEGQNRNDHWIWGYDEICWFARQEKAYRNDWLRYAWKWVRENDPNGYLQMPGSRCLASPAQGRSWYFANRPSTAVPDGFGQEDTIKAIWQEDSRLKGRP